MKDAKIFLENLEKLIQSPKAYMLSANQYNDLTRLRDDAQDLCNRGELDRAHELMVEMQEIVEEGSPVQE